VIVNDRHLLLYSAYECVFILEDMQCEVKKEDLVSVIRM